MDYDVVFVHPPAIYDFRKKALFSGALGPTVERVQFVKAPLGMLSIADYLDRYGYKVLVDNLADRMACSKEFDPEEHIKNTSARIFAVDLHFHPHSQGALEVARLCKELHPDSLVILGGLTATCYHQEIIRKYRFVDAVLRAEAEKPFLELVRAFESHGRLTATPNLTYRTDTGEICVTPLMPPSVDLDEFEFTRFDLLEPKTSILPSRVQPRGNLPLCRGCMYHCATCGGSAYSFKTYFGMKKPAFRSPGKIVADIKRLGEQGIRAVGLYQDPRMGGEKYWKELMAALRQEDLGVEGLSLDLFAPADEEFIRQVATIGWPVVLYMCADSGCTDVRRAQGRRYSNEDLLSTVKLCHRYHIPVTVFFSVGLAGETPETIQQTWRLWEVLCLMDQEARLDGSFDGLDGGVPLGGPIVGPILLEPGSLALDFPERHGYQARFANLEEYIALLSAPSWHQWINYETRQLDRNALLRLIFESLDYSIQQREKYGVYEKSRAAAERRQLKADFVAVNQVDGIICLPDGAEREAGLKSLRAALDDYLQDVHQDQGARSR